jgi:hypothetical protein
MRVKACTKSLGLNHLLFGFSDVVTATSQIVFHSNEIVVQSAVVAGPSLSQVLINLPNRSASLTTTSGCVVWTITYGCVVLTITYGCVIWTTTDGCVVWTTKFMLKVSGQMSSNLGNCKCISFHICRR